MKYTVIIFFLFVLITDALGQQIVITNKKDTLYISTKDTTVSKSQTITVTQTYPIVSIVTKPFKPPIINPPPTGGLSPILALPKGQAQTYNNRSNLIIENLYFDNKNPAFQNGNILWFNGCNNITIRNCYFGASAGVAIYAYGSSNIKVENCLSAYTKGFINASRCTGGISIKNSQFVNSYGSGAPYEGKDGNIFKLTECTGPGYLVENCVVENFVGESNPEDIISLYASQGTVASPITITGNIFRGGGPSQSGGGIVAGDGTNSFTGGNVLITNNKLVDPGQYGIAAGGGSNITITGNQIFAKQQPWTNNPLFVWNQYTPPCSNVIIRNNRANWTDRNGNKNPGWNAGNCSSTIFEFPATITLAEIGLPAHIITLVKPDELLKIRKKEL